MKTHAGNYQKTLSFIMFCAPVLRWKEDKLHHLHTRHGDGAKSGNNVSTKGAPPVPPNSMLRTGTPQDNAQPSGAVLFPCGKGVGLLLHVVSCISRALVNIEFGGRGGTANWQQICQTQSWHQSTDWCSLSSIHGSRLRINGTWGNPKPKQVG
jgi:hypothetical protein